MYPVFILVLCYVLVIHVPSLFFMSYYVLVIYVPHLYFIAFYILAIDETTYIKRNGRLLNSNDYTHTTTINLNNEKQLT